MRESDQSGHGRPMASNIEQEVGELNLLRGADKKEGLVGQAHDYPVTALKLENGKLDVSGIGGEAELASGNYDARRVGGQNFGVPFTSVKCLDNESVRT